MDDATEKMIVTVGAGIIKKGLITIGASLATHGLIASNQTETFASAGMFMVGVGWSLWTDYGKAIVLSQLEVLKAKSLAQAAKLRDAGLPQVTVTQIAQQSDKLTPTGVSKTVQTLPKDVQKGVADGIIIPLLLAAFVLSLLFLPAVANAQAPKRFVPTGDLVKDIQSTSTSEKPRLITGDIEKDAHAIWDKIVSASNADLKYASALAGLANTPASMVRKQCYDAILDLNTQVNGMNLKDAQGNQLPQPDPKLFTGVEQAAETIDNLSPSGKLFTSCAGMAQLTKTNVLTLINAIVTGAAGFAAMPIIPGL